MPGQLQLQESCLGQDYERSYGHFIDTLAKVGECYHIVSYAHLHPLFIYEVIVAHT